MKKSLLIGVIGTLIVLVSVTFYLTERWLETQINSRLDVQEPQILVVQEGTFANQLLSRLANQEVINNPLAFKLKLRLQPQLAQIKAGTYELLPGMTGMDMLFMLSYGQEKQFSVSLVEGLRWTDWKTQLTTTPYLLNDIGESLIFADNKAPNGSLEGLLLPETYHFTSGTRASEIARRAYQSMEGYLAQAWHSRDIDLPLNTPYEALILASIVEKETGVASERPLIAGVFMNRLRQNMRLQTDPTVIYGMGEAFDGDIRRKDLRTPTPYNTYVIKGLPPTPIAMPGKLAIDAVMHPQQTDALYFVSKGDGSHYFSETLKEHNQAVRKYQLKQ